MAAPDSPVLPLRYPVILANGPAIRGAGTWGDPRYGWYGRCLERPDGPNDCENRL
jgi:hypothetical protein